MPLLNCAEHRAAGGKDGEYGVYLRAALADACDRLLRSGGDVGWVRRLGGAEYDASACELRLMAGSDGHVSGSPCGSVIRACGEVTGGGGASVVGSDGVGASDARDACAGVGAESDRTLGAARDSGGYSCVAAVGSVDDIAVASFGGVSTGDSVVSESGPLKGPNGGVSVGRGPNYTVNQAARERRKRAVKDKVRTVVDSGVSSEEKLCEVVGDVKFSHKRVTTQEEQDRLARQWFERKEVENKLAIQKAEYQYKRNEWLSKSRVSEKKWEEERLRCEEKLEALSKARLGHGPAGFAETIYSDGSVTPPSLSRGDSSPATLSDGTLSPDSSISVAELRRIEKKFVEMEEKNKSLELCVDSLKKLAFDSVKTQHGAREFDEACGVNSAGFAGILKDGKRLFLGDPGFEMPITASNCGYTGSDVEF